jgi:alpha-D-xyloside xylohydrolase
VFNEEGTTNAYLPDEGGAWTNLFTGEKRAGGRFIPERHDYFSLGLWVKPNSIVAIGSDATVAYDYADNPVLHVFELTDRACAEVYSGTTGDTDCKIRVALDRSGNDIKITANEGHGGFTLLFRNMKVDIEGFACEILPEGTKVTIPANCTETTFRF